MNADTFFDWIKTVVPLLKERSVIVMDNASYNSVKCEQVPTMSWKKADIEKWLENKGKTFDRPIIKVRLMELVKQIKSQFNKYVIDEFIKSNNMIVLRLPPYYCKLNAIELAWTFVKNHVKVNNSTFKIADVEKFFREGIERCIPEMWSNFVRHTKTIEDKFWEIDFVVEEVMENYGTTVMSITSDTSSSEFESDPEQAETSME